jgi:hypothetical protein
MSKYYVIIGWEYGADRETEICKVDQNPDPIVKVIVEKTLMVRKDGESRRSRIPKYSSVRVEVRERASA